MTLQSLVRSAPTTWRNAGELCRVREPTKRTCRLLMEREANCGGMRRNGVFVRGCGCMRDVLQKV